ncbi:YwbE family protein [Paenibacillus dendrobii]
MESHMIRASIKPGMTVEVVKKEDQRTGKRTQGIVQKLLTNSPNHTRGIKVRLTDGTVGRVQAIVQP